MTKSKYSVQAKYKNIYLTNSGIKKYSDIILDKNFQN